jgi:hypothetical protein
MLMLMSESLREQNKVVVVHPRCDVQTGEGSIEKVAVN